jgi:hypothetical protein
LWENSSKLTFSSEISWCQPQNFSLLLQFAFSEIILKFNLYWNFKLLISMNLKISCHLLSKYFTFISISISVCDTERRNLEVKVLMILSTSRGYVLEYGDLMTLSRMWEIYLNFLYVLSMLFKCVFGGDGKILHFNLPNRTM